MSDDMTKWFAYAQNHSHEETARLLMTQADEIARLRSVCRMASKRVKVIGDWGICDWVEVRNIAAALADAGKEPSDGTH